MMVTERQTERIFLLSITMASAIAIACLVIDSPSPTAKSPVKQRVTDVEGPQAHPVDRKHLVTS
jgi:hypothetical protein